MKRYNVPYTRLRQNEDDAVDDQLQPNAALNATRTPSGETSQNEALADRRVDYVLVYETSRYGNSDDKEDDLKFLRVTYEESLRKEGLFLEDAELIPSQVCVCRV